VTYDVVIPTTGRPTLEVLLAALGAVDGPLPGRVVVVDDRPAPAAPLQLGRVGGVLRMEVVQGGARGPAAARNQGWRACDAEWIAFLDDDVVPSLGWREALARDLSAAGEDVGAVQGRVRVPLHRDRRPTDWERNVAGLERARWATADLAYRRRALEAVGGFDERFPRAYREDSDLGLRLDAAGIRIAMGNRHVLHPVPDVDRWVSLRKQAGNADDALMRALHGRGWRERASAPRGRLQRHALTAAAGLAAVALMPVRPRLAGAAALTWLGLTAELAAARIARGPATNDEVATMLMTSSAMPFVACWHRAAGELRARRALMRPPGPLVSRRRASVAHVP
jgi:hypothetical protein